MKVNFSLVDQCWKKNFFFTKYLSEIEMNQNQTLNACNSITREAEARG